MMLREQLGHLMLERQAMITQREGATRQLKEKDEIIDRMLVEQQNKGADEDKEAQELLEQAQREVSRREVAERRSQIMVEAFTQAENTVIVQDQMISQMIEIVNNISMDSNTASRLSVIKSALDKEREFHKHNLYAISQQYQKIENSFVNNHK